MIAAILPGAALSAAAYLSLRFRAHTWAGTSPDLTPMTQIVGIGATIGWGALAVGELLLRVAS